MHWKGVVCESVEKRKAGVLQSHTNNNKSSYADEQLRFQIRDSFLCSFIRSATHTYFDDGRDKNRGNNISNIRNHLTFLFSKAMATLYVDGLKVRQCKNAPCYHHEVRVETQSR